LEIVLVFVQRITFLWKCLTPDIKSVSGFKTSSHIYHSGRSNIPKRLTLRKVFVKNILLLSFDIIFALLQKKKRRLKLQEKYCACTYLNSQYSQHYLPTFLQASCPMMHW
jgi:hypothetical protein